MKKFYLTVFILLSACSTIQKGDELPNLKGLTPSRVINLMGKPSIERKEAQTKMWAYCQEDCSTLVFFDSQDIVQYAEQRGKCPQPPSHK